MSEMRLYDIQGKRLYLNAEERAAFLDTASLKAPHIRIFAETLHYTGCRISEALEVTPSRVDLGEGRIVLRSLKKRRNNVFRAVPVPRDYIDRLELTFGIRQAQKLQNAKDVRLWDWTRQHAWHIIKNIMIEAGIPDAPHRTPKGLRHAYGINAVSNNVPLNVLQKWLGHAQLTTTAIYADAAGKEETALAAKMWE